MPGGQNTIIYLIPLQFFGASHNLRVIAFRNINLYTHFVMLNQQNIIPGFYLSVQYHVYGNNRKERYVKNKK